ncbi:bile acid:sodium symporter family protein [Paenibacillus validus]|uniref:Bile acid:sodium symporter family protein n=1 Tax=Paenibacillus validus TaxID=44253 RepID=A0A7X3CVC3_9BACL|nr:MULTISPECIES: bile acid:sodium symporter family protein [Paenibacillus]MED4599154.1 bile acid:sodium symporter family protein [Paenibacillus validus]MED4606539.1 bile acid:sodium symporter family protein [Paenibacillus validus]MUG73646.1 bile acid:sodium symporter family protein [Paenibacillus validus]
MNQIGNRLNTFIETYLFLLTPVSLILGFLLSEQFKSGVGAIPLLFAYLTFVMASGCSIKQIREALRMPGTILLTFVMTHIAAPLVAYALSAAVFGADSPYVVGFVLFAIIPLGVSSVLWVSLSRGHVPFTLAMIVIDTALSPLVIPGALEFLFGASIELDHAGMLLDLVMIVVAPTLLGILVNELSRYRFKAWSAPFCGPTSKLALCVVILINAAAITPHVVELKGDLLAVLPLVVILVALCYGIGLAGSLWLRKPEMLVTLTYVSGMRNISLGLVLALAYFSPLTAVPVVLSILFQQPFATINSLFMKKFMASRLYNKLTGVS